MAQTAKGELIFKPYYVQSGVGPHLLNWAYASDTSGDAFHSNITATHDGVKISDSEGKEKFGINVRWNVEGFGYIYITVDNGGQDYQLPGSGKTEILNLNFELAKSRVARNRRRIDVHKKEGWKPSHEVEQLVNLSEAYFDDAKKIQSDGEQCGLWSQQSLLYAMGVGEKIELEKAEFDIQKNGYRPNFFVGCDARA